jgi:hypothetical protein
LANGDRRRLFDISFVGLWAFGRLSFLSVGLPEGTVLRVGAALVAGFGVLLGTRYYFHCIWLSIHSLVSGLKDVRLAGIELALDALDNPIAGANNVIPL